MNGEGRFGWGSLALGGLLLGSACGGAGEPSPETAVAMLQPQEDQAQESEEAVGQEPLIRFGSEAATKLGLERVAFGDLDELKERRIIRALVVFSKTNYFLDGPKQLGATYEGLRLFEDWLNKELGTGTLKTHVLVIPVPRDRLFPALNEGLGDIAAAGLTITPGREELVDFTDPIVTDVKEVVVTGPSAPPIETLEDLSGKEIYVRFSSSYYESLTALNQSFRAAGKAPIELVAAEEYLEDEDLLEMVDSGLLATLVVDQHKAEFWDQIYDNITVRPELAVRTGGAIAWAFRKGSPKLEATLNRFVAQNKKGTLMGNIILKRYLKDTTRVKNVLTGQDRDRFGETIGLFQKYAPRYAFDYLMMVAQGYQESGLDQSVVSPVGAIGIMQVLPTTAAEPVVDIPDIASAENNVHAGIKYMHWIREHYFEEEEIDDLNKTLFAFASYNGGPNRIARLRRQASERGLDPNVWFRNVEVIASEVIGRETVQYVSNIYKYYAAYKLMQAREQQLSSQ